MADDSNLGDVAPRKKGRFGTYVIIGVISLIVILGVTLFMPGDENGGNSNGASPNPNVPTTIADLQAQITTTNDRIATLEATVAGIAGPTVTQTDIAGLQTSIDSLTADVANWTEALEALEANVTTTTNLNISSGLTYWLTKDTDGDIRIHVLSAEDITLMAEVTLFYDDPIQLPNAINGTYGMALSAFYNQVGTGRDYAPSLVSTGSPEWIITYDSTTYDSLTWIDTIDDTVTHTRELVTPITTSHVVSVTTNLTWEYSIITFHVGPFDVEANEVWNDYIDESYLLGYDTVGIKLFPTKEETGSSNGDNGL